MLPVLRALRVPLALVLLATAIAALSCAPPANGEPPSAASPRTPLEVAACEAIVKAVSEAVANSGWTLRVEGYRGFLAETFSACLGSD